MWKLAWRNLWRRRSRTIIVSSAIALTTMMMLISFGMGDSFHTKIEQAAVRAASGSVVIQGKGYLERPGSNNIILPEGMAHLAALREVDHVKGVVPRVVLWGLLRSATNAANVRLLGVDPEAEAMLEDPREFLSGGVFLDDDLDSIQGGPLVLGEALAKDLGVTVGGEERIVFNFIGADGEERPQRFRLVGVLKMASKTIERQTAYTPLAHAQRIADLRGGLSTIGLVIEDDRARAEVRAQAESVLSNATLEVVTWDQVIPEMLGFIEIDDGFNNIFTAVFFIIVAFGIVNTLLMSVLERTREFGLLSALGLAPGQIGRLIFYETLILALLSLSIGYLLGYGAHIYLSEVGVNLQEMYGDVDVAGVAMNESILRSEIRPLKWALSALAVFALIMASALYPAWRATHLDPVEAMRTYE